MIKRLNGYAQRSNSQPHKAQRLARCDARSYSARSRLIAPDVGTVTGVLDGERYEGKERFLSRGIHTFARTPTGHVLVVFWAQAVNRHFIPIESNTSPHS
jgi:hypothetical protein